MMEFTREDIVKSIEALHTKRVLDSGRVITNDDIIRTIRKNVLEGKIQQSDIQFIIDRIYPTVLDEKGLEINNFTLFDENFVTEYEKEKAQKYLNETDWIIAKIGEEQLTGVDVSDLIAKYSEQLLKRKECRELL